MQAYNSYEGYIKDGNALPLGIMPHIHEGMKAIITILNEPADSSRRTVRPPFKFGCAGDVWMADDFDAPLDDFAEYM
jgi:hypothetical protein